MYATEAADHGGGVIAIGGGGAIAIGGGGAIAIGGGGYSNKSFINMLYKKIQI